MTTKRKSAVVAAQRAKGAAKSQRQRWAEHDMDVYSINFVRAEPGHPASVEHDRIKDARGRRVWRVTVRVAGPLTVNGCRFPLAAAFEALATDRCGTGELVQTILPHASEAYGNEKIRGELCSARAEHLWKKAQKKPGQGKDPSYTPTRRRSRS